MEKPDQQPLKVFSKMMSEKRRFKSQKSAERCTKASKMKVLTKNLNFKSFSKCIVNCCDVY